jgi:hypothetical protein
MGIYIVFGKRQGVPFMMPDPLPEGPPKATLAPQAAH